MLNKLMTSPSKAKNQTLARLTLLFVTFFCCRASSFAGQDIRIQSGPGQDSIMEVGPNVGQTGSHASDETIRMESDPNTGSIMQVTPRQQAPAFPQDIQTIIVTPEIRIKEH